MRAVVSSNVEDSASKVAYKFAVIASEYLKYKNFEVKELFNLFSTRDFLFFSLLKPANLFLYAGHGEEDKMVGFYFFRNLIDLGNVFWLKGRIVYSVSCLTAKKLGKEAVEKGTKAFLGYRDYVYVGFVHKDHNYMDDFIDTWLEPLKVIANNGTAKEAYNAYIQKCNYYIDLYQENLKKWENADWYLHAMKHNRDSFVLLGNENVRLSDTDPIVLSIDWRKVGTALGIIGAVSLLIYGISKRIS